MDIIWRITLCYTYMDTVCYASTHLANRGPHTPYTWLPLFLFCIVPSPNTESRCTEAKDMPHLGVVGIGIKRSQARLSDQAEVYLHTTKRQIYLHMPKRQVYLHNDQMT